MKKTGFKALVMIAAITAIVLYGIGRYKSIGNTSPSPSADRANGAAQVQNQNPIQYGRIVLSERYQTIVIPSGYSLCVTAVENSVRAMRLVNGDLDMGEIIFLGGNAKYKDINTLGRVLTDSYMAADKAEIGKSLVYCLYPEGQVIDRRTWPSQAIASTIR